MVKMQLPFMKGPLRCTNPLKYMPKIYQNAHVI